MGRVLERLAVARRALETLPAGEVGLLDEEGVRLALDDRNLTVHPYNEALARAKCQPLIMSTWQPLFRSS
ncbi:hypothetical protein ACLWNE_05165 [Thermus oshimai]|uniref:hypothetical protein n=1 Tax=Thermus oshimai TaxID=56957 RepID=UPI0039A570F0